MTAILNILKKAFLWSYPRNTWQWDVLCVVILIFIFMTPKSWFANGERRSQSAHQSGAARTVVLGAELVDMDRDRAQLEQRVRTLSGQPNAEVLEIRPRQDATGKTIAYEVDIR